MKSDKVFIPCPIGITNNWSVGVSVWRRRKRNKIKGTNLDAMRS